MAVSVITVPNLPTPEQNSFTQESYLYQMSQYQATIQAVNNNLNSSIGAVNTNAGNITTLQGQFAGLPSTFVTSLHFTNTVNGAIILAGSCVEQGGTGNLTFSFYPFGTVKREALPYVYTAGDTTLVLTPSLGNITFTLPAANSVPNGWTIFIRNSSNAFVINVSGAGADTFNGQAGPFPMTARGNAFSAVTFQSDGVSDWITIGSAG